MTPTTLTFTLFFLAVFTLYWWLHKPAHQNGLLLVSSYVFYAAWDYRFCAILLASSLIDYSVARGLEKVDRRSSRRALLAVSLIWNLGVLCFFKYANFFLENFQQLTQLIGWRVSAPLLKVVLPVGVSFFTFKTLSYTIDIFRWQLKATPNVVAYMAYVAFFPQLLAGPIDRAANLLPQLLAKRAFNYEGAVDGCRQILWGLFKKKIVADNLGPIVDHVYRSVPTMPGPHLGLATLLFAFQIYCDFSAYSDIAIGVTKLLGFTSVRNFAYPYFSQSMAEFWRRWHISLMNWFRDYVYFPLGGLRGKPLRRSLNLIVTFLLSGLWHGASWNFLIWGGLNGCYVLPTMFSKSKNRGHTRKSNKLLPSPKVLLNMIFVFLLVCTTWIFFRAQTVTEAAIIYKKLFLEIARFDAYRTLGMLFDHSPIRKRIIFFLALAIGAEWLQREREHPLYLDYLPRILRWTTYTILLMLILRYGMQTAGEFVYFRF